MNYKKHKNFVNKFGDPEKKITRQKNSHFWLYRTKSGFQQGVGLRQHTINMVSHQGHNCIFNALTILVSALTS